MAYPIFTTGNDAKVVGPCLSEPTAKYGGKAKCSLAVTIPKSDKKTCADAKKAIDRAISDAIAKKWDGKRPAKIATPLRDGDVDREGSSLFSDRWFVNASTSKKPILLHLDGSTASADEFATGATIRAKLSMYPYSYMGRYGIACGLEALWLVKPADTLDDNTVDDDEFDALCG